MGVGTSDGKYYESEFEMLAEQQRSKTPKQRIDDTFEATKEAIDKGIMDPQGANNLRQ